MERLAAEARIRSAGRLLAYVESGAVEPPLGVAGAFSLVWQALEWLAGTRR